MPLTKKDFEGVPLLEALYNISLYFEYLEFIDSEKIRDYLIWNTEIARDLWPFPNFNFAICKIRKKSSFFFSGFAVNEDIYYEKLKNFEGEKKRRYFN